MVFTALRNISSSSGSVPVLNVGPLQRRTHAPGRLTLPKFTFLPFAPRARGRKGTLADVAQGVCVRAIAMGEAHCSAHSRRSYIASYPSSSLSLKRHRQRCMRLPRATDRDGAATFATGRNDSPPQALTRTPFDVRRESFQPLSTRVTPGSPAGPIRHNQYLSRNGRPRSMAPLSTRPRPPLHLGRQSPRGRRWLLVSALPLLTVGL